LSQREETAAPQAKASWDKREEVAGDKITGK
jgi:hypothetical protein